ncbi:MAG TPA: hypothetical protein VF412_14220 [Bdellovibrio sp.]|uniref:hypothetical protein n=1 Tax=Bdellovibrio sp. TaxID=28201 RepID=UPI002F13474B
MKLTLLALLFFTPILSHGACLIPVSSIEQVAQKIQWRDIDGNEQNSAVVQGNTSGTLSSEDDDTILDGDYEIFARPDKSGAFQILPLPLFEVELNKKEDSVYLCAHFESQDETKTEAVIYFLRNGHIRPMTPQPLPLLSIRNIFNKLLHRTPFVIIGAPIAIAEKLQRLLMNGFGDLTKFGVDRIRITNTQVELYSGGDPAQFDHYVFKKVIKFDEVK